MNDKIKRIDEFKGINEFKTIQDLLDKYMDGATSNEEPCILLVGKYPNPSDFPLTTYNTEQGDFAEVLYKNFQKVFLISYYGKVSEMPNK